MAGLKFRIHPLFFLFGIYYAFTGKIFIFLIFTLTALLHELGHLFKAEKLGFTMHSLTLMPYGAAVSGNISGLRLKDQTALALAGPAMNFITALIFTAAWWVFPDLYAFTDVVVTANLTIGVINLIPAYPLDGGRILFSLLAGKFGETAAKKTVQSLGFLFFAALTVLFAVSVFYSLNLTLLLFALFILTGLFTKPQENVYVRLFNVSKNRLTRGVEIKKYAVGSKTQLKKVIALIDANCFAEIAVLDEKGNKRAVFSQTQLLKILESGDLYDTMEKFIV